MHFDEILAILDDIPDYRVFRTVDELGLNAHRLAAQHLGVVEALPIGCSRQGGCRRDL